MPPTSLVQSPQKPMVLAIDDEEPILNLIGSWLAQFPVEYRTAQTADDGMRAAASSRPGMILLDLALPDRNGMDLLRDLVALDPGSEIVVLTGTSSVDSAVEAIRSGATDYISKPLAADRLLSRVQEWIEREQSTGLAGGAGAAVSAFQGIVGGSKVMVDLYDRIEKISKYFTNVLIIGETGTGKELVAQALHNLIPERRGPFVVCNCAAVSESLFESELFGHKKGSFTGAHANQTGLIEHAAGGTLFLDEIGEVPLTIQAKLLRFLQSREIQKIGDPTNRKVDVRVVAASNRDLEAMAKAGGFRPDLFYRLSMVTLRIPSLRERPEDLEPLQRHFLERFSTLYGKPGLRLSKKAKWLVTSYGWPGNVRELENALQHAAMMASSSIIEVTDFPDSVRSANVQAQVSALSLVQKLDEVEVSHVLETLNRLNGNRRKAAEALGISRTTLYRILEKAQGSRTQSG